MGIEDLVVASTSDTEAQMHAALMHGVEDTTPPAKVEEKPAAEEPPAEPVVEAKAPVVEKEPVKDVSKARPRREDFQSEDEWGDALMGHRAKKRIDTLTYEREEARRKSEALEARIAKLEAPGGEPAAATVPAEEPKAEAFETHEEWIAALVDFKASAKVAAAIAAQQAVAAKAEEGIQREEEFSKFIAQRADARARYDDFDEVIADNGTMELNGVMNFVIMSSEVGNDISYYLANHRDEAEKIYKMSGPDAIRAMGKLEAKVEHIVASIVGKAAAQEEKEPTKEPTDDDPPTPAAAVHTPAPVTKKAPKVSQTAAPIEPVGSRSTRSTVPDEELPYADYKAKRDRDELNRKKFRR